MILSTLSESLKAVFSQRLLPAKDGSQMHLAAEVMIGNLSIANLIKDSKTFQIRSTMQMGTKLGMKLMDDAVIELLKDDKISLETAQANVDKKELLKPFMAK